MPETPEVLDLAEAVAYLRIDEKRLRSMVAKHRIGHIKLGHTITFPRAALEAWVAENTTAALGPNPYGLSDRSLARVQRGRT